MPPWVNARRTIVSEKCSFGSGHNISGPPSGAQRMKIWLEGPLVCIDTATQSADLIEVSVGMKGVPQHSRRGIPKAIRWHAVLPVPKNRHEGSSRSGYAAIRLAPRSVGPTGILRLTREWGDARPAPIFPRTTGFGWA